MRRSLAAAVFLALQAAVHARPDSLLLGPPPHSQWGFAVADTRTGAILAEKGGRGFLIPASTLKLLTTAFVWEKMGASRRFPTRLYRTGPVENGVLRGDLWIRGSGNPALGSERGDSSQRPEAVFGLFAEAVKRAGIREIDGGVYGDPGALPLRGPERGALWEDIGNYYGAAPSGLCFHDNFYVLRIGAAGDSLFAQETRPRRSGVSRFQFTARNAGFGGDSCFILGAFRNTPRLVAGDCPAGPKPLEIKGSLPDPAWTCAREFEDFLRAQGVSVKGLDSTPPGNPLPPPRPVPADTARLAEHGSLPLSELVGIVNLKSDNLYAAQLLELAGGLPALKAWLADRDAALADQIRLEDGTGLSLRNHVTPEALARFLARFAGEPWFEAWRETLGRGSSRLPKGSAEALDFREKTWVKTGSMAGVSAAAGYARARSGRLLAFAVIVNHFDAAPSAVREGWEPLLRAWRERY
jgi:D-alanyl-D-alanine carboxypeptidase/D-alanyl-D-alanine-endopeptidase (penicillin-binding protein 4)